MSSTDTTSMVAQIASLQDYDQYADLNWEGSFEDYLKIVKDNPDVTRNSFQRAYDMILSYGRQEYMDAKKKLVHYSFFDDPKNGGKDGIYGLDIPLMKLVNVLRSAAQGYGPEKRVILLHGPGGLLEQVDDRALAQEGARGVFAHPRGRALHLLLEADRRRHDGSGKRRGDLSLPDERRAAEADPGGLAR
jgi:serine protein kinase